MYCRTSRRRNRRELNYFLNVNVFNDFITRIPVVPLLKVYMTLTENHQLREDIVWQDWTKMYVHSVQKQVTEQPNYFIL